MSKTALTIKNDLTAKNNGAVRELVTLKVAGQLFGIDVALVQDVIRMQKITPVPLADEIIAGSLNLRGRIVTAIDVRKKLRMLPKDKSVNDKNFNVVVENNGELYSLIVDSIGDVLKLPISSFEANPANLDKNWSEVSNGVFRLNNELMIVLDIKLLLNFRVRQE